MIYLKTSFISHFELTILPTIMQAGLITFTKPQIMHGWSLSQNPQQNKAPSLVITCFGTFVDWLSTYPQNRHTMTLSFKKENSCCFLKMKVDKN